MDGEIFVLYIRGCIEKYKERFILCCVIQGFIWISSTNNYLNIFPYD